MLNDRIINNKIITIALFLVAFTPTFIKSIEIVQLRGDYYYNIIIAFLLFLLLFYLVYFTAFIIQLVLVKLIRVVNIKYFVVYPFTYDGKFKFHPIKLIYNVECFRDTLPMNLVCDYKKNNVKSTFRKLNFIRMISLLLSFAILASVIQYIFGINFYVQFIIGFIGLYLSTYTCWGFWKGNNYLVKTYSIIDYFVLETKVKELSCDDYIQYMRDAMDQENREKLIVGLVKYLNQCLYQGEVILSAKELYTIISENLKSTYTAKYEAGSNEVYVMHAIKMIGIVGKLLNNDSYKNIAVKRINEIKIDLVNQNMYGIYDKVIREADNYCKFIIENNHGLNYKHHLILKKDSIFYYQDILEHKILKELLH